jgi:hypothetical protein
VTKLLDVLMSAVEDEEVLSWQKKYKIIFAEIIFSKVSGAK